MNTEFEDNHRKMAEYRSGFARYNDRRKAFFRRYFRLYHRFEAIGVENIPDGPALIAANHGGAWDFDIITLKDCCLDTREVHPLIAESWHYLNSAWGRYWIGGGIPLWTTGGIRWEYIDPYLDKNGANYPSLVAIYPEGHSGTFKDRNVLHRFFPGVVRIALRYRVPIVPVGMIGFHYVSPILAEIKRDHTPNDPICLPIMLPVKLRAEFGKPFDLSEYYGRELTKAEEFKVANEVVRPRVAEILSKYHEVTLENAKG